MRELFNMDKKDYTGKEKVFSRPSARAIIHQDDKLLLVWVKKYDFYKFPGGGIEKGESNIEALIREVKEETGYEVIEESIKEYGHVLRKRLPTINENEIFEQDNYYYFCDVKDKSSIQKLDEYETDWDFIPKWMNPYEAYLINIKNIDKCDAPDMVMRDSRVLKMLDEYYRNK